MNVRQRLQGRPAETGGGLGAAATFVAYALGCSVETVAAVGVIAGLVPAAVTLWVDHGGLRGIVQLVLNGRQRPR
jgi:hypothetical protein